jgi:hypothetical protein
MADDVADPVALTRSGSTLEVKATDGSPHSPQAKTSFNPCDYPRPTNGILVAITVMNNTLASSGRPAM